MQDPLNAPASMAAWALIRQVGRQRGGDDDGGLIARRGATAGRSSFVDRVAGLAGRPRRCSGRGWLGRFSPLREVGSLAVVSALAFHGAAGVMTVGCGACACCWASHTGARLAIPGKAALARRSPEQGAVLAPAGSPDGAQVDGGRAAL